MTNFLFARQPILDGNKFVFGYELLFRNSLNNAYSSPDGNHATLEILSNAFFHASFQQMVGDKRGLLNFTRDLLLNDAILLFSPEHLVVEILEDVVPDDEIAAACTRLKKSGYKIALDDFVAENLGNPLLQTADIVKVDFLKARGNDRKLIADRLLPLNIMLLAEKVETDADYRQGLSLGYKLFQGYFFSEPIIKVGQQLAPSQIASMRMVQAVFRDQCDYNELNEIISSDISLSYRMLKLANSPFFDFRTEITSIRHAITLVGCCGMKRFVSLLAVSTAVGGKSPEIPLTCLARAKIGEEMAPLIGFSDGSAALFLTGLFSLLDALLDCSMEEVLAQLSIAREIKSALLGGHNRLRTALDAIVAYERGDWEQFSSTASAIGLPDGHFPALYTSGIEWANNILKLM